MLPSSLILSLLLGENELARKEAITLTNPFYQKYQDNPSTDDAFQFERLQQYQQYEPGNKTNLSDPFRVFRGTTVEDGEGVMVVDAVGILQYTLL